MYERSFFCCFSTMLRQGESGVQSAPTKGDQAVKEILVAAKRLFLSQGYNGTSMRAIASEAGYKSVAGLYNHFGTKHAIFEALVEQYSPYEELLTALESIQAATVAEFFHAALKLLLPLVSKNYDFIQLAQIDIREFQGATIGPLISAMLPRAFAILQRAQRLPGFPHEEGIMLIRFFASIMIGYAFSERLMPAN